MNSISITEFQKNMHKYLNNLPVLLTKRDKPMFAIMSYDDYLILETETKEIAPVFATLPTTSLPAPRSVASPSVSVPQVDYGKKIFEIIPNHREGEMRCEVISKAYCQYEFHQQMRRVYKVCIRDENDYFKTINKKLAKNLLVCEDCLEAARVDCRVISGSLEGSVDED